MPVALSGAEIRFATREDVPVILGFIRALAEYEQLAHAVTVTEDVLAESLFGEKPAAEVLLVVEDGGEPGEPAHAVGFALFFMNFSTFVGRPGIYLEDLFVLPEARRKGYGRALFERLAAIALERGCQRLDWAVLDWNRPAIDFYEGLGSIAMDEWTVHRLTEPALRKLAACGSNGGS
ncbi:MAG: GNAT family N-acetyltransferase [Bryobacterales bacterium]|nr:GNAT family N-acetyltransferase [Bryobacterales bacterium]